MPRDLHSNDPRFVAYYDEVGRSDRAYDRAVGIMKAVTRARRAVGASTDHLDVADIGCNTGAQSRCWLEHGHMVSGIDISRALVTIAKEQNKQFGVAASFEVGSATALPWRDSSFDICLMPELLEHVEDWACCLREAVRVLRPGGTLYVSTTNVLCLVQDEFNLPAYSWYPGPLKRYFLERARTDRPELANFATFPAMHWFSPYSLGRFLSHLGVIPLDRFDLIDTADRGAAARLLIWMTKILPPIRFAGHVLTSNTIMVGHKRSDQQLPNN